MSQSRIGHRTIVTIAVALLAISIFWPVFLIHEAKYNHFRAATLAILAFTAAPPAGILFIGVGTRWLRRLKSERSRRSQLSKGLNGIWHVAVAVLWAPQVASYAFTFLTAKRVLGSPQLAEERVDDQDRNTLGSTLLVWSLSQIALGYYLIEAGYPRTGLYMLLPTCILSLPLSVAGLKIEDGAVVLFRKDRIESSPLWLIGGALVFALGFGGVHFAVSQFVPGQYMGLRDWQDAVYFSVMTVTTVGCGDILPTGHLARWLCALEIACGVLLFVVAFNASISVWLQEHHLRRTNDPVR